MGNPRSASNAWAPIRKKLFEGEGGTASPTKSTSKRASKKNGAAVKEEDEDEPEETTAPKATPSKRKAANKDGSISPKKRGKAAAVKQEDREDSVTEGEVMVKS